MQQSKRAILHLCYQAVRAAAEAHNPYATLQELAQVGEALADKIELVLTSQDPMVVTFNASDADNYDYLCAILDEIHKTIPVTHHFNVILHMERLPMKDTYATPITHGDHRGEAEDLDA